MMLYSISAHFLYVIEPLLVCIRKCNNNNNNRLLIVGYAINIASLHHGPVPYTKVKKKEIYIYIYMYKLKPLVKTFKGMIKSHKLNLKIIFQIPLFKSSNRWCKFNTNNEIIP